MSKFEDYIKTIAPNIHIPSYAKRFENVVEVVRCKDCVFFMPTTVGGVPCLCCNPQINNSRPFATTEEKYCAWAKRREDE